MKLLALFLSLLLAATAHAANGTFYILHSAAGAGNGTSWANAYTSINAATTANTGGGDTFWVADTHNETPNADTTIVGSSVPGSPSRILCVNTHTTEPPTGLATTGAISQTGTNSDILFTGFGYVYGMNFNCGSASNCIIGFNATTPFTWKAEACLFRLNTSGTGASIQIGPNSTNTDDGKVTWVNCTTRFGNAGQGIIARCPFLWEHSAGAVASAGTIPTSLFLTQTAYSGLVRGTGLDFVAMGSGNYIVDMTSASAGRYEFFNCKRGPSSGYTTGSVAGPGGSTALFVNCDTGDTGYKFHFQTYAGTITDETTIVRTGGSTDGTTPNSRKMVTTANASFVEPLESRQIFFWANTTGSTTVTIPILPVDTGTTTGTTLTNAQAWMEVSFLGTSGFPLALNDVSSRVADIMASPANQPTDAASTWTTTGITTPVKQYLTATVTIQEKGLCSARVYLAKPSTTMYYDPLILSGSGRQYQTIGGFINEGPTSGGATGHSSTFGE